MVLSNLPHIHTLFLCIIIWQVNLASNNIGSEGAKPLADALRINASVSHLDARYNDLGDEGKAILREAVKEKPGFELLL